MSFLSRFRILTKILAIVLLLSAVAGGISYYGIQGLARLNDGSSKMEAAARRSLVAARMNQNVIALNRAEFRAALDPRNENRTEARNILDRNLKQFLEQFEDLAQTPDPQAKAMIPAIRDAWAEYQRALDANFKTFEAASDTQMTATAERLRDAVVKSRASAEKLQGAVRAVAVRLNDRVVEYSKQAHDEYDFVSRVMMVVTIVGILLGAALGYLVGQFGIAKPMRGLVAILQQLARGEDVAITGADRKDEIGQTAQAVNGIKDMLAEKARQEEEAKRAAAEREQATRKADMHKLADNFQSAVGGIIDTVSSASTELEAAAGTLTKTAEVTQELSGAVAAASEQASANVQSVASATEEMTSSVTEIGRQVQESARIAGDAVKQAHQTLSLIHI